MSEKAFLGIEEITKAIQSLNKLLAQTGVDRKRVYWLGRNRDKLTQATVEWSKTILPEIIEKHSVEMPTNVFIPPQNYKAFRDELIRKYANDRVPEGGIQEIQEEILNIMAKYEKISEPIKKSIPPQNREAFEKEAKEAADNYKKEIEYTEINLDNVFDNTLSKITGEDILAISFMFREASSLEIKPGQGKLIGL